MAYANAPAAAVAGMISDSRVVKNIVSRSAEVAIPPGRVVCRGASDAVAKLPTATGMVTATQIGVSVYNAAREPGDYAIYESVPIMDIGEIWVSCETSSVYGDPVFARFTTAGGGADLGQVRNDADTARAVALPGAHFIDTGTGAGLRRISLNKV